MLHRTGGLLIAGFERGKPQTTLDVYDLNTGARRWRSSALHGGSSRLTALLTAVVQATQQISPISSAPVELSDGSFLLAANGRIYRMRADTGAVVWQQSFAWGTPRLFLHQDHANRVFVGAQFGGPEYMEGTRTMYHCLRLDDGQPVWPEPVEIRGAFNPRLVFADQGLIVSEHTEATGRLRMLDYATGQSLWGKKGRGLKIKGGIVDHAFTGDNLVITTGFDSAWNDQGTEYLMYVVALADGALLSKKPVKVKGRLRSIEPLASGVLFITTHQVDVLDPATGSLRNRDLVRGKRNVVVTRRGSDVFVYNQNDGNVYALDTATGVIALWSDARVRLQAKDIARTLEWRKDTLVVTGQQNVAAWRSDGSVAFERYHAAPRRPALVRALLYAQAARNAAAAFASGVYAAGFADASTSAAAGSAGHAITSGLSEGYAELADDFGGVAASYMRAANERFHASRQSRDFVFMMVRADRGRYGLAQVSKDSGEIITTIDLGKENEPTYQVDDIASLVFHQPGPSQIVAYKF